jgi:hypothetical protein
MAKKKSSGLRLRNQKSVFDFLVDHLKSQKPFLKKELEKVTTWRGETFRTYWSKQFEQFTVSIGKRQYRVSESFRPYATWSRFRQHVTQVRHVYSEYTPLKYEHVIIYEFFMPLTNEAHLRTALDAMFYRDTIQARLLTIEREELDARLPKKKHESEDQYWERVCSWISKRFVGYSINHVDGRFLVDRLSTMSEAARIQAIGGRYLIDETTAIVRFIFPCQSADEAAMIEWFFKILFVRSMMQVVSTEDEIWMVESGMNNRLHIWRSESEFSL